MSNGIEQGMKEANFDVEARGKHENLSVEPRVNPENISNEPRANNENFKNEQRGNSEKIYLKRRGSGEDLLANSRGTRENLSNEQLVILIRNAVSPAELMLQLWQQNYGLIYKIASRYKSLDDIEDLLQEGFLGLYEAVRHYNPDTGVPFVNYAALWIRQTIGRYVKRNGTIRIPEHAGNQVRAYKRMISQWESEFGRKPTEWEMCHYLDVTLGMLRQIEKDDQMGKIGSLDVPIGEEEDGSMYDMVPGNSDQEKEIVERLQQEQLRDEVWKVVDNLPEEQSIIIRMRYQHGCTLKEAGEYLGISVSQARTIESKALREIRKPSNSRRIRLLLEDDIRSRAMSWNGASSFQNSWTSSTERAALWMEDDFGRYFESLRKECGM